MRGARPRAAGQDRAGERPLSRLGKRTPGPEVGPDCPPLSGQGRGSTVDQEAGRTRWGPPRGPRAARWGRARPSPCHLGGASGKGERPRGHPALTSVGVTQGGRLGRLGLLPLDGHHHLFLHALPARRAGLHLLVGRQSQRRVVLVLEAFVGQGGLERRVVHGGAGAGLESEPSGARCGRRRKRALLALSGSLCP